MWYRSPSGLTRRDVLTRSMGGFGSVILSWMLHENPLLASNRDTFDLLPRQPHFEPKAKAVIFLFMPGGPSQIDTLDPKPLLNKLDGQAPPMEVVSRRDVAQPKIFGSPFKFQKHGRPSTRAPSWKWTAFRSPTCSGPLRCRGRTSAA